MGDMEREDEAAVRIQRAWRRYCRCAGRGAARRARAPLRRDCSHAPRHHTLLSVRCRYKQELDELEAALAIHGRMSASGTNARAGGHEHLTRRVEKRRAQERAQATGELAVAPRAAIPPASASAATKTAAVAAPQRASSRQRVPSVERPKGLMKSLPALAPAESATIADILAATSQMAEAVASWELERLGK